MLAGQAVVALAVAGAATTPRPSLISIAIVPGRECAWQYDGHRFQDSRALVAALPKVRNRKDVRVRLVGDPSTPYRCVGGLVFELQVAGYADFMVVGPDAIDVP